MISAYSAVPHTFAPGFPGKMPSPGVGLGGAAKRAKVLVVDDEPNLRKVLSAVLTRDGHEVVTADGGRDAVRKAKQMGGVDLLVTDFLMPDLNGLEVLEAIRKQCPALRALVISGHGTVRTAVEAMRLGAFDFLTKPFEIEQVRATVERALQQIAEPASSPTLLRSAPASAAPEGASIPTIVLSAGKTAAEDFAETGTAIPAPSPAALSPAAFAAAARMVGDSPATQTAREGLLRAAGSRATVLLLGESGTGKEVAARLLHDASPRKKGPFVAVSCAALPESLLESELFGHEKSAFTGALAAKPGRFELADGGTLFLDEIGDIPAITQVKLLRALQEREICRIGGVKTVPVNVRVIAATNRDLWKAVQEGSFRLDLYYRLHVIPVTLPPLRNREGDIPLLAHHLLARIAEENDRVFPGGFAPEALRCLEARPWPGNIRELQNAVEYAVVMSSPNATRIEAAALPPCGG